MKIRLAISAFTFLLAAHVASAACVNRFVNRNERVRQVVTLLTGKLTFQEAQTLAASILKKQATPLEWVSAEANRSPNSSASSKWFARCRSAATAKTSGVVLIVTFPTTVAPDKKMLVKLNAETTIPFDQQAE